MTDDSLIGQRLDEYRLETLLGQGGMARVYRALDVRLKRYAAIKVIDVAFRADTGYMLRFEHEAQAVAKLEHPHIVGIYRYGEVEGLLYIAMQYVEGSDLASVLATYREDEEFIEPEEASRLIRQVCLALDYAHDKGVIHRDLKPSNIMLNMQGNAILTDFGLALLIDIGTRGEIFGSPHYIAPEQAISSAGAVSQSDLYAVGVMLYEMFTGQLPFDAEAPLDIAMKHISETPRPPREVRPEISPELESVILKALAKEPAERYPDGAALADALDQALQAAAAKAPPASSVASGKTIYERVALELDRHPLPPISATPLPPPPPPTGRAARVTPGTPPPPPEPETAPVPEAPAAAPISEPISRPERALPTPAPVTERLAPGEDLTAEARPASTPWLIYAILGAVAVVGLMTILCLVGGGAAWLMRGGLAGPAPAIKATTPTVTAPASIQAGTTVPAEPGTVPSPTVPHPEGRRFIIYYNDGGLYLLNDSGDDSQVAPLAFERLGASGQPLNRFDGWRWSRYYPTIQAGKCARVEIQGSTLSRPSQCKSYNIQISATRSDDFIFWTPQEGSSQFRVLWNEEEIARCEIAAGVCEVPPLTAAGAVPPVATEPGPAPSQAPPASVPPTQTPIPSTPSPVTYELLIAKKGEDSLFVANLAQEDFPLDQLRLGEVDEGGIRGADWGTEGGMLKSGQCVTAWKSTGKPKAPKVQCHEVGQRLPREKKEIFWKSEFSVYYDGERIKTCEEDEERCTIRISISH